MELAVVAAEAAALIWRLVRGAASEAEGILEEESKGIVRRLWDRLRGNKAVEAAAEDEGDDALEELARQIERALQRNEELAGEVASLVDEAKAAGAVVEGHALVERVRAGRDIRAEGGAATVRDADAGQDIVARAKGAPDPKA